MRSAREPDAVVIDGQAFRDIHAGYQAVVEDGRLRDCVWREAFPDLRLALRQEKGLLLQEASMRRMNLIIPHTCQAGSSCLKTMRTLRARGYVNHVVMVLGDRDTIRQRGEARARASGKRYAADEWSRSVRQALRLASEANGDNGLVWTTSWTGRPRFLLRHASAVKLVDFVKRYQLE
eukprot:TRINITY_DN43903_c0_g1_i2.p1 TRINITY_DN43903_c0_g1~~TRINITY_DN43903_c0_g1_i2.p1  ORF type:complete len:178 (-),score=20.34 TRINITY_DN43903_c0_g1_i2:74-607(-)